MWVYKNEKFRNTNTMPNHINLICNISACVYAYERINASSIILNIGFENGFMVPDEPPLYVFWVPPSILRTLSNYDDLFLFFACHFEIEANENPFFKVFPS